jgi:hypothetical protein
MSYSSRVYRQRNPKVQEESKDKPFFPKQKSGQKGKTTIFSRLSLLKINKVTILKRRLMQSLIKLLTGHRVYRKKRKPPSEGRKPPKVKKRNQKKSQFNPKWQTRKRKEK